MSNDILETAEKLGKMIHDSAQAANLRAARAEMEKQPEVKRLLEDFRRESDKIANLEQENKPVEVEDKHKLQDLQDKLVGNEAFKKLTGAQVEYVDLMRKVNASLRRQLGPTEGL